MKKFLIGILAGLCAICGLDAQEYGNNLRRWEQGKLTWEDFSKREAVSESNSSLSCMLTYDFGSRKTNDTALYQIFVTAYADKDSSWVNANSMNDTELRYQQVIFDLTELEGRSLQQKVNRLRKPSEIDSCFRNGMARLERETMRFKTVSRQGTDVEVIRQWEDSIRKELANSNIATEMIPRFTATPFGFGAGVGIGSHLYTDNLQNSFRPNVDVTLGLEFAFGRSEILLHAGLGGTRVKPDSLPIPGERWSHSDHLECCQLSISYGYRIGIRHKFQFIPFVGYGTTEISTIAGQNDEIRHKEKTGGFLGGICMDYLLRTTLNIAPTYLSFKECHSIALRTKVYIAQANFSDHLNGMTLNFSFSVNIFDKFVRLN